MENTVAASNIPNNNTNISNFDETSNANAAGSALVFAMQSVMQQVTGTLSNDSVNSSQKTVSVHGGHHAHQAEDTEQLVETEQQIEAELAINNLPTVDTPENAAAIAPTSKQKLTNTIV